jgi:intein/homing endonuclease
MDGDGSIKEDGNIRVSTASQRLAEDVQELVRSLGGDCRIVHVADKKYTYRGAPRACRDEYRINGIALRINPFWLPRKSVHYQFSMKAMNQYRRLRAVEILSAVRRPM